MNYTLNITKTGNENIGLYVMPKEDSIISIGYSQIITTNKHPYIEFTENNIILHKFYIPKNQLYRFSDKRVYYIKFENIQKPIEMRYQLEDYSFFKKGMFYISAFDLYTTKGILAATIKWDNTLVVNSTVNNEFFEIK